MEKSVVVLVEDNEDLGKDLHKLLSNAFPDFKIVLCRNEAECIEAFKQHKDQLRCLIADRQLKLAPGKYEYGTHIIDKLRKGYYEARPGLPVALMSGGDVASIDAFPIYKGDSLLTILPKYVRELPPPPPTLKSRNHNADMLANLLTHHNPLLLEDAIKADFERQENTGEVPSSMAMQRSAFAERRIELMQFYLENAFKDGPPDQRHLKMLDEALQAPRLYLDEDSKYYQHSALIGKLKSKMEAALGGGKSP